MMGIISSFARLVILSLEFSLKIDRCQGSLLDVKISLLDVKG